jgi:hypothetical protein
MKTVHLATTMEAFRVGRGAGASSCVVVCVWRVAIRCPVRVCHPEFGLSREKRYFMLRWQELLSVNFNTCARCACVTFDFLYVGLPMTRRQKWMYTMLVVVVPWLWQRGNAIIAAKGWSDAEEVCSCVNLCVNKSILYCPIF